ncbi:MAG: hypothetical protein EOO88_54150 [Pedobacter sp.]|nr:MAG: hypothetical protein EOO88_54150 [Pedobacter sp.]
MLSGFRQTIFLLALCTSCLFLQAQHTLPATVKENITPAKPYRILTSGKSITVKSTKDIKSIMVWTADGHRVLEQKDINAPSYNFRISINARIFFLMVQLTDGKTYSEKFGL